MSEQDKIFEAELTAFSFAEVLLNHFGNSGSRTFYSDQSMVIRQNYGQEPATANSPEMK